jgi:hypothetical protein
VSVGTLAGLCGAALFLATGLAIVDLLSGLRNRSLPGRFGFAYVLGVAWTAGAMYAFSHFGSVPLRRATILPIALAPIATALVRRLLASRRREVAASPEPEAAAPSAFVALAFVVPAFLTAGLLSEAVTNPVNDWDGRMTWALLARYVREEGTVRPRVLVDDRWSVTNRGYPLLMPLAQVAVEETFDTGDDDRAARPLYAVFFPAFLLLLFEGACAVASPGAAASAVLVASVVPMIVFETHGGAAGCFSDFPLGCFFGAGLLLLLPLGRRVTPGEGVAAGLLLGAALLTKAEGFLLAPAALAIASLRPARIAWARLRRGRPDLRPFTAPALAAAVVLGAAILELSWRNRLGDATAVTRPGAIVRWSAGDAWRGLAAGVRGMAEPRAWGVLWLVAPLVFVAGGRAFRRRRVRRLVLGAAAPVAVAAAAYGINRGSVALATGTFNRFLIQGGLPIFCVLAACLFEAARPLVAGALLRGIPPRRSPSTRRAAPR